MLMPKCQNLVRVICIPRSLHLSSEELPVAQAVDQVMVILAKSTFTKEITLIIVATVAHECFDELRT